MYICAYKKVRDLFEAKVDARQVRRTVCLLKMCIIVDVIILRKKNISSLNLSLVYVSGITG